MPPKKAEEHERKPLIGRVGTNLRVGIVGVPNVGKSTFFNVLTKSAAPAENFPFCTIDPNENKYPNFESFITTSETLRKGRIKQIRAQMDVGTIAFTSAEPITAWIESIVFEILNKMPSNLFGESRTWNTIITQYPFIHEFNVPTAKEIVFNIENRKIGPNVPLFPLDASESESNFQQFIKRKPLRIMITGDMNASVFEIAELLVMKLNTYHITPKKLIRQQITKKTETGKWLLWILKGKRQIPTWVVLKLLESELRKDKYTHKGFILSDFPIIPNLSTSFDIPCKSIDLDYENISDETLTEEFATEKEAELILQCSSFSSVSVIQNTQFIHMCEDEELKSCAQRQLDFIYNLVCRPEYIVYLDTNQYTKQFTAVIDILQQFVLLYSRENVIQIDCRIGIDDIFKSICNRFEYINYKVNYDCSCVNANANQLLAFEELCNTEKILPNLMWWVSQFGRICPVNLHNGRLRLCKTKYPARYMRYMFLFYSSKDRNTFMVNPNKYMDLVPSCRVAVIGPHRSGKSTLSKYLARYFKADIYEAHTELAKSTISNNEDTLIEKELETLRLLDNTIFKLNKIEEWTECVIAVINEVLAKVFYKNKQSVQIFSYKQVVNQYFQNMNKGFDSDIDTKQLILENLIYEKSNEIISSNGFLEWVFTKTLPNHKYRQYVLDSAPLDIAFWKNLQENDELPDCVFFFKISSLKKMFDLYSLVHDETCISEKLIFENVCSSFSEWREHFKQILQLQSNNINVNRVKLVKSIHQYKSYLVARRFKNAVDFVKRYDDVKAYLEGHNVPCIDVDISNQSWTQTILKAIIEYMSLYQPKATLLYETNLNSSSSFDGNETQEDFTSSFYHELNEKKTETETDLSIRNYGNCLDWCPVLLHSRNVLLKGDRLYSVSYKNKIYVMHSKNALTQFLSNPKDFSRKPIVPPPRVFILGLNHKNKLKFAESLAASLNVEHISYMQDLITMHNLYHPDDFSINSLRDSYDNIKKLIIQDLTAKYERGAVIFGFPLILEQFNDVIGSNLYPECVLIFDDKKELLQAMYRHYARLQLINRLTSRVPVPDERFDFLCDYHKPISKVPAYLNVVDIAGLVKGAAEGQGLGNAFLSHISACDAIFHLCRAFEDPDVTHVEGEVDPVRDLDIITEELRLKDEEKLLQNLDKLEKVVARGGDKKLKPEYDSMCKVKNILMDEKRHLRFADWNVHDIETLNKYMFLTSKPVIYLVNLSDKDFIRKKNKWLAKIKEWVDKNDPGAIIIPFSGHFEHELAEKEESERKTYEEETKCKSVLDKIIITGYKALQLEYFFTAGADEVKAWTIQKGTKAPQAAGRIHTDFEKGFIMAEVMHFKDFKEEGSEAAAKSAGKYRQQGRNYVVEDGDIIFFKFNAGAGLKDPKKK